MPGANIQLDAKGKQQLRNLRLFVKVMNSHFNIACGTGCRRAASKTRGSLRGRLGRGFSGGKQLKATTQAVYSKGIPAEYSMSGQPYGPFPGWKHGWHRTGALANSLTIVTGKTQSRGGGTVAVWGFGIDPTARSDRGASMIEVAKGVEHGWSKGIKISGKTRVYIARLMGKDIKVKDASKVKAKIVTVTVPPRPVFRTTWEKMVKPMAIGWFMRPWAEVITKRLARGSTNLTAAVQGTRG